MKCQTLIHRTLKKINVISTEHQSGRTSENIVTVEEHYNLDDDDNSVIPRGT